MTATTPPPSVSAVLDALLEGQKRDALRARAQRVSQDFRDGRPSSAAIRDETDALAYALTRLPATYAATAAVLGRLRREAPDFAPLSLIDAGCGLASGAAAALEAWPDIARAALLDRNDAFLDLARRLIAASPHRALSAARIERADLVADAIDGEPADLVIASYALTELTEAALAGVVEKLWRRTAGALAIIEPGTPRDYARLMRLRQSLILAGARIALPCPHERTCPLPAPDWCHFGVRLARSREHRRLKSADAPFEDEKFCYLVATRAALGPGRARAIAPPRLSKGGLRLRLCATNGIVETNFAKRDRDSFRNVRSVAWGDTVPFREDAIS